MSKQNTQIAKAAKVLAAAVFCISATSSQTVELSTGKWIVDHTLSDASGANIHNEQSEFCLTEANNTLTFDQILDELNFAQCRAANVVLTQSTGRADVTCTYPDAGDLVLTGTMEATYSSDTYRIESRINETGTTYLGIGRRTGACTG